MQQYKHDQDINSKGNSFLVEHGSNCKNPNTQNEYQHTHGKRSLEVSSRYQIKFYLRKKADSPGIPTIQQPFGKPT